MSDKTFAEIERERAALSDARAKRIAENAAWFRTCDARLKELSERTAIAASGVDLARVDRALMVLQVMGDPTKVVNGSYPDQQRGDTRVHAIDYARRLLAETPDRLKDRYIGIKNYSGFGDQREDHQYGYGPRHGTIVFSIGLTIEARKRDLTADEVDDALYFLHVWPTVESAKRASA